MLALEPQGEFVVNVSDLRAGPAACELGPLHSGNGGTLPPHPHSLVLFLLGKRQSSGPPEDLVMAETALEGGGPSCKPLLSGPMF